MVSVLLTGAGGAGTIEIIRTLRALGGYRVVAVDASAYAHGLVEADSGYVVPLASEPDFTDALSSIIARERVDYVVPLVDEEILLIHEVAAGSTATVIAPNAGFCATMMDKYDSMNALGAAGVAVPETWLAGDEVPRDVFPVVVKPRSGRGSRGLGFFDTPSTLGAHLEAMGQAAEGFVVQRRAIGAEYTVSGVGGLDGQLLAVVPKEVLLKRGVTLAGVTRRHAGIEEVCRAVNERLSPMGPFNVQLIEDLDRGPLVIEVNPRYSTTVALTIAAGVHEIDLVVRHHRGDAVGWTDFKPDLVMLRHQEQEYLSEDDLAARAVAMRWGG